MGGKFYKINFGPQHPAAHGVLRLLILLTGETVVSVDPHIGLLHRGTEKLIEFKNINQGLPYMDRLDYVSMMAQEHCYALVFEKMFKNNITKYVSYVRTLFLEITRILNHLMSVTTHAMDVGALTPFLWAFEEREKLMEIYEKASGARMHANYIRVGGVSQPLTPEIINLIYSFMVQFRSRIDEMEDMLTNNNIWAGRLKSVGIISLNRALNWGFSGVLLRSTGVAWDLRKTYPYEQYPSVHFNVPVGLLGDCYDRYMMRIQEMRESLRIIYYTLFNVCGLFDEALEIDTSEGLLFNKKNLKDNMETLIKHFNITANPNLLFSKADSMQEYVGVESPKGEFGLYVGLAGTEINRMKIRAPGYYHLQGLQAMSAYHLVADVVTIIGTQDIVFGEVDR